MAETSNSSKRASQHLMRFISIDSTRSSTEDRCYETQSVPLWGSTVSEAKVSCSKSLKLQIVAVICTGLYSKGLQLMTYSITSLMFPNIVFASYMIITGVIILSYVLGYVMPDIIVRIFNTIGAILYFVTATITGHFWFVIGRHYTEEDDEENVSNAKFLLAQVILSALNSLLYGFDVYLSVKNALKRADGDVSV